MLAVGTRERLLIAGGTVLLALASGALLGQASAQALLLVSACAFGAFAVVSLETPIVAFATLVAILALAPEETRDDSLTGLAALYDPIVSVVNVPLVVLVLLVLVLALTFASGPFWPGAPATAAIGFLAVAVAYAVLFGPLQGSLLEARPIMVLVLAIFAGYWLTLRYGSQVPLRALVVAAAVAIPFGLYNAASGEISYYDSSPIYLIGLASVLVLFRVVDIGFARAPFLLLSVMVVVLSLRRGAMLGIAVTVLITGLVAGHGTFRAAIALIAGTVIGLELFFPEIVLSPVEGVVNYFTGASGQDFNVNYRRYETENVWLNVKDDWLSGLGPFREWTLYRNFDGDFDPETLGYVHNSYLSVWLRLGLFGLIAFGAFLLVSVRTLLRRSAPLIAIVMGASMIGLIFTLATASFLTTTTRWPLTVGLLLGIALAAFHEEREVVEEAPVARLPGMRAARAGPA